jgi:hypothetical protein
MRWCGWSEEDELCGGWVRIWVCQIRLGLSLRRQESVLETWSFMVPQSTSSIQQAGWRKWCSQAQGLLGVRVCLG